MTLAEPMVVEREVVAPRDFYTECLADPDRAVRLETPKGGPAVLVCGAEGEPERVVLWDALVVWLRGQGRRLAFVTRDGVLFVSAERASAHEPPHDHPNSEPRRSQHRRGRTRGGARHRRARTGGSVR